MANQKKGYGPSSLKQQVPNGTMTQWSSPKGHCRKGLALQGCEERFQGVSANLESGRVSRWQLFSQKLCQNQNFNMFIRKANCLGKDPKIQLETKFDHVPGPKGKVSASRNTMRS